MNRRDLEKSLRASIDNVLKIKDVASFTEVLMDMGKLKRSDYEDWRFGRIPYLERVIQINLSSINFLLRGYAAYCKQRGLAASETVYMKWGKGCKHRLRFSKSRDPHLENAYATHYLHKEKAKELNRRAAAAEEKKKARLKAKAEKRQLEREVPKYGVEHHFETMQQQWTRDVSELHPGMRERPSDQERPTSTLSNTPWKDDDLPF